MDLQRECRERSGWDAMTEAEWTGLAHEDIPRPVELSFSVSELCATLPPPTTHLDDLLQQKCRSNWVAATLSHPHHVGCSLLRRPRAAMSPPGEPRTMGARAIPGELPAGCTVLRLPDDGFMGQTKTKMKLY
jgi:hypothetical protein